MENKKSEHHQWIQGIPIILGIKFQLKLVILIFLKQICPKRVFLIKKRESPYQHWILHAHINRLGKGFHFK